MNQIKNMVKLKKFGLIALKQKILMVVGSSVWVRPLHTDILRTINYTAASASTICLKTNVQVDTFPLRLEDYSELKA